MRTGGGGSFEGRRARFGLGCDRCIQQRTVATAGLRQKQLFRDERAAIAAKRAHRCADRPPHHAQTGQRVAALIARGRDFWRVGARQCRHLGFADQFRRHCNESNAIAVRIDNASSVTHGRKN